MSGRRLRQRKELTPPVESSSSISANRPRRAAAQASAAATASVAARDRETTSPDELRLPGPSSLKLKVGSRLREVENGYGDASSGVRRGGQAGATSSGSLESVGRRVQKKAIVESSDEDDEEEEDEEEDADADGDEDEDEDNDEDEDDEDDEDAEGDEDEDVDMIDAPPTEPPKLTAVPRSKPNLTVTMAQGTKLKSVEQVEMEMGNSDDEELSELDSAQEMDEQDGGELDDDDELDGEDEDAAADSDEGSQDLSGNGTPDPTKLTRRQRGEGEGALLALSNEAQKKKHLTAEEHAARRTEMARRRKNLSEKRNEEEKMDTINRLLKKQAPKRRSRKEIEAEAMEEAMELDEYRSSALYVRWVNGLAGSRVAVPAEILAAPDASAALRGGMVKGKVAPFRGRMVEEVPIEAN